MKWQESRAATAAAAVVSEGDGQSRELCTQLQAGILQIDQVYIRVLHLFTIKASL